MGLDDTILDMVLGVLGGVMVVGLTAPQRLRAALGVQNIMIAHMNASEL
ncbi:MAG: hypothetical protein ACI856_002033 [Kiritimatiellia bacterium]|jgi:hypothetical protein